MAISTTITKAFFEMKMQDLKETGYFWEYKESKIFWKKRLDKDFTDCTIVFLVGSVPHRFRVADVLEIHHDLIPEKYQSAIHTDFAYAIRVVPLEVDTKVSKLALATMGY
jgi:hypothetical protein